MNESAVYTQPVRRSGESARKSRASTTLNGVQLLLTWNRCDISSSDANCMATASLQQNDRFHTIDVRLKQRSGRSTG